MDWIIWCYINAFCIAYFSDCEQKTKRKIFYACLITSALIALIFKF